MNILNQELMMALLILFGAIVTNVGMGYLQSNVKGTFDKEILVTGIKKGLAIFIGVVSISVAAQLDTTIMFNDVPIIDYVRQVIGLGYIYYYAQVVVKIVNLIGVKKEEGVIDEA